ncbi:hypothetical protein RJ640_007904 [Escallonia rubra]|uniref:Arabinanase/levansucrase/invertase n=1 Tax=Escallonia rubra TaxID=112253 RepID=A0AA88QPD0_9ASTE|nr:hypothetical protein RJ640_007904 [Escallonia rubra]
MDTPLAASISATNTVFLATPATRRVTTLTTITPSWPLIRVPNQNHRNKSFSLFLTHCSAKPDTDTDNAKDQNSTVGPDPNPSLQNPAKPTSNQAPTSSNSSFSRGLVFDLGPKNSWDGAEIGSPVVKRYLGDEEERWHMWYHGRSSDIPGSDSIGLAVSSNGIHWERGAGPVQSGGDVGLVLNCSKDWWAFDTHSIRPCEVVVMSSTKIRANSAVYWLYYTGYISERAEVSANLSEFSLENPERVNTGLSEDKVSKSLPGLAMSQDGRHWARIEGEHHTGALLDVGSDGEWDSMFIASPQVVFHGSGDLRMYYHSFDVEKGHFAIGMARSRDGLRWLKLGKIVGGGARGGFDEFGAMNARVVRNRKDGKYVMAYEGVAADGRRSIGMAVSADGLKDWRRLQAGPVLKCCEEDGWDNEGVGSPCLVQMDGEADEWRLYYRGVGKGGQTGIGMAVSEGSESRSFIRWMGFQL